MVQIQHRGSRLDANAFSKNAVRTNPAVDSTAIVADLKPFAIDGLHEVQIFSTPHSTEHDVPGRESGAIDRRDRAEVAGFYTMRLLVEMKQSLLRGAFQCNVSPNPYRQCSHVIIASLYAFRSCGLPGNFSFDNTSPQLLIN
jgi:hypothetical protein